MANGWGGARVKGVSERQKEKISIWEDEQRDPVLDALLERLNRAQGRRAEVAERVRRAEKGKRAEALDQLGALDSYIAGLQDRIFEYKEEKDFGIASHRTA